MGTRLSDGEKIAILITSGLVLLVLVAVIVFAGLIPASAQQEPTKDYLATILADAATPTGEITADPFTPEIVAAEPFLPTQPLPPTPTLPAAAGATCINPTAERVQAEVIQITDGDTIVVAIDGVEYKLRYIGVDTPETGAPGGALATEFNRALVEGKTVTLVKDVSEVDHYDRLLRYVFVGDMFVNYVLVQSGYATSGSWPPDTACDQVFSDAFQQAKAAALGITSIYIITPTATTEPATANTPGGSSLCPTGCTSQQPGCDIKGNINTEGEKIYHQPGDPNYERTVISPEKGERWFCTIEEAVSNGWRPPRN